MSKAYVIDSETDGLAYECTKLHVLSWTDDGEVFESTNNYKKMIDFLLQPDTVFVAHNGIGFDLVVFWRILGLTEDQLDYTKFWDSLWMSRLLFPDRPKHGLEALGVEHGVKKPKVDDWENLSYEDYKHRCEEDVKINWLEFIKQKKRLDEIYG